MTTSHIKRLITTLLAATILSGCANITTLKITELDADGKAVKTHIVQVLSETKLDVPLPAPSLDRRGKAGQVVYRQ